MTTSTVQWRTLPTHSELPLSRHPPPIRRQLQSVHTGADKSVSVVTPHFKFSTTALSSWSNVRPTQYNGQKLFVVFLVHTSASAICQNVINQLLVSRVRRNTFGTRAFSVTGPTVWNSLPDHLRNPLSSCWLRTIQAGPEDVHTYSPDIRSAAFEVFM